MATSNVYSFGLEASQVVDQALNMVGGQQTTANEIKAARLHINLMCQQLENLGVNMWAVDRQYITLIENVGIYQLDPATVDVIPTAYGRYWNSGTSTRLVTAVTNGFQTESGSTTVTILDPDNGAELGDPIGIVGASAVGGVTLDGPYTITSLDRDAGTYTVEASSAASSTASGGGTATVTYYTTTDLPVTRIPLDQFSAYPQKQQTGPARQFYLNRALATPTLYLLPLPDGTQQQLIYWRKRKLSDVPDLSYEIDIPSRFLSPFVFGLAYRMAFLRPQVPKIFETQQRLKAEYEQQMQQALDEDREPAPTMLMPDFSRYYR